MVQEAGLRDIAEELLTFFIGNHDMRADSWHDINLSCPAKSAVEELGDDACLREAARVIRGNDQDFFHMRALSQHLAKVTFDVLDGQPFTTIYMVNIFHV